MDWLTKLISTLPTAQVSIQRQTVVQIQKVMVAELDVCHPKVFQRERPFWQSDQIDIFHLKEDGSITHTPCA